MMRRKCSTTMQPRICRIDNDSMDVPQGFGLSHASLQTKMASRQALNLQVLCASNSTEPHSSAKKLTYCSHWRDLGVIRSAGY
jgi:hypothetical protein